MVAFFKIVVKPLFIPTFNAVPYQVGKSVLKYSIPRQINKYDTIKNRWPVSANIRLLQIICLQVNLRTKRPSPASKRVHLEHPILQNEQIRYGVRYEVFTLLLMEITDLWYMTFCWLICYRHFGQAYCLNIHGRQQPSPKRRYQTTNQHRRVIYKHVAVTERTAWPSRETWDPHNGVHEDTSLLGYDTVSIGT
jgi:hypothetical protein